MVGLSCASPRPTPDASPPYAAARCYWRKAAAERPAATTHWKLLDTLQSAFPEVRVEGRPLYIQDGPIWTSGGVSSGFDLTLALVEDDYGFTRPRYRLDMVM